MPSIAALILGLVQGLTEFLPVSSSGHLVIAAELLGYQSPGLVLETVVHVATTLVVLIYFRTRFLSMIRGVFNDPDTRRLVFRLFLAFEVTSVIGIGLKLSGIIDTVFESPAITGAMLLVTALALFSLRFIPSSANPGTLMGITWRVALVIGLAQGIAIFPGISRSGLTIIAALWLGQDRSSAAEFSFLLAVPTLLAASLFSLVQEPELGVVDIGDMVVAFTIAFASGLVAMYWLMRLLQGGRLWWFAVYCLLVGGSSVAVWGLNLP